MAPSGGPQGHIRLHDCTGKGHIGWEPGEVVPGTDRTCYVRALRSIAHKAHTADMPHEHLRHRHQICYAHNLYCAHGIYCCARSILFKVTHLGLGAGGWVLLGSMGRWCRRGCQKLYGLVRQPLATLHRAAGEPLRQAPNNTLLWNVRSCRYHRK